MMGCKERAFGVLPSMTLEDLISPDHFYHHLEQSLDLGFVRDWTQRFTPNVGDPASTRWCSSSCS
jgi:hypothetical protein